MVRLLTLKLVLKNYGHMFCACYRQINVLFLQVICLRVMTFIFYIDLGRMFIFYFYLFFFFFFFFFFFSSRTNEVYKAH